ncbi:MAG: hypothetical protein EOP10_12075 [Proteobacteria bacterium]|nr:MAG: hypothetical protein EOP10_12075 [Pseudomonadota bacterium]
MAQNQKDFRDRAARRELYIGENIRAYFTGKSGEPIAGEVVSLSEGGLGFLCDPRFASELEVNDHYQMKIYYDARSHFTTSVSIRNKSQFTSQGVTYLRVGVAVFVDEVETTETKLENLVVLSKNGAGFIEIDNPMFFDDKRYFRIRGVHPRGMVLEPMDNRHFLLPNQNVVARFTLPGLKPFDQELIIKRSLPKQGRWLENLLIVDFFEPSDKLLMRIAKYILILEPDITVKKLQENGFPIPFLDFILHVEFAQKGIPDEDRAALRPSVIAPHSSSRTAALKQARTVTFWRKNVLIASLKLNFCRNVHENSALNHLGAYNHQLNRRAVVELLEFYHHPDYPLPSIIVPVLQHCILTSIQAKFAFLAVECTPQTEPLFNRLGFTSLPRTVADDDDRKFVALGISNGLYNMTNGIHRDTWERVYKRLYSFLSRKFPHTKNVG